MRCAFALFREGKVEQRARRLAVCSYITWRRIDSTDDLTTRDLKAIIQTLEYWKACGALEYRCGRIAASMTTPGPSA
ncbi:hypothetical protein H7J75_06890 [Mycolicibacterium canariasense]|nr:hypothetical protein [Mycolicibacterium canariasense]ORV13600.1 hypothetical protein AWB94_04910 [Mycolicibacterium canariasense]